MNNVGRLVAQASIFVGSVLAAGLGSAQFELPEIPAVDVLRGHGNWVYSAQFSRDGDRLITASRDNTARVWAYPSGETIAVMEGA